MPSKAVTLAKARRAANGAKQKARMEVFLDRIQKDIILPMADRVKIATEMVRSQVVKNISISVYQAEVPSDRSHYGKITTTVKEGKKKKKKTYYIVRSIAGEFPRAETTMLMKTIFSDFKEVQKNVFEGYVGTPLDYGLILEVSAKLDRRFLRRTLEEMKTEIDQVLTGPQ